MEKVGDRVDGRFHHGDQAADQEVAGQRIGDSEGDREVGDGEGHGLLTSDESP